jgi:hypothetical protein
MSWFGKILTFLVFIGAGVWAYFAAAAFVTRTNWQVRADQYKKAFEDSEKFREKEARANAAALAALNQLYDAEKKRVEELDKGLTDLKATVAKDDATYKQLLNNYTALQAQANVRDAQVKAIQDELKTTRDRNNLLQDQAVALVLLKEAADRAKLGAENDARLARAISDENAKRIETLTALVTELKQTGGAGGTATVLRSVEKAPAPLPENIRGTVEANMSSDGFVLIGIGIDAGLEPGSKLDVYRESGGGKYLGTLTVTGTLRPKEAVAEFRPARPVGLTQLRPDELPKKGDIVGRVR